MNEKLNKLVSGTFAILGVMCISSGLIMPNMKFENGNVSKLEVKQQKVAECKSNEIKLKNIEIEMNNTLSSNVSDYLENPNDIENSILKILKLDISNVNVNSVGDYTYTITFNKKIYNGSVKVKDKPLPVVEVMTLNQLSFEINSNLPTDISAYVKETLPDEVKAAVKLDLTNVNPYKAGRYLYSVSYNGKFYTSSITIYEPKSGEIETEKQNENKNIEETEKVPTE